MKCPGCNTFENKVIDSRLSKEGEVIRRRRECLKCKNRFTTYEQVENNIPMVVKKDGRREIFDRQKILHGMKKACEKRPVSINLLEEIGDRIEKNILETGMKEVTTNMMGEEVMKELHKVDQVAYVRFASVYREFKDINEFMEELKDLMNKR